MGVGPVGFGVEQQELIWAMWRRGDPIRAMERTLGETLPRIRRYCVNRAGSHRSRGGAGSIICLWPAVRRSPAGSRPVCKHGRSPGALTARRRRYRGRSPAMVAAMRTGRWSPTQPRSSGRGARNRASWRRTPSYGAWSPPSWTPIGHRSRSPSGCGGSISMTRRCRSRMSRSTVMCICLRGKCLTPVCSTAYAASVRSDGHVGRSARTVAARSGTSSPSASDRSRPTPGRWPGAELVKISVYVAGLQVGVESFGVGHREGSECLFPSVGSCSFDEAFVS